MCTGSMTSGGDAFDPESAQKLETMYKVYDLLYGFCSKYGSEEDLVMITGRKRRISDLLMRKFEENAFERSRCTRCGRRISWLSPYKVCDRCFRNRRRGIYYTPERNYTRERN